MRIPWTKKCWNKLTHFTLKVINQRIADLAKQDILGEIEDSQKRHFYNYLVDGLIFIATLESQFNSVYRNKLLAIDTERFNNTHRSQTNCFSCKIYVEDEFQIIAGYVFFFIFFFCNIATLISRMDHQRKRFIV